MQLDRSHRRRQGPPIQVAIPLACALALAAAVSAPPATRAESRRDRLATLASINTRWEGADCALRFPVHFKKKKPENGWYESIGYFAGEAGKVEKLSFRLKLRDLRALGGHFVAEHVIAGTPFRCDGFKFRDQESYDHAFLALRAQPGDIEAELWMWAGSSHPELKQLESVEQYLRLSVFNVRGRQETLQRVAGSAPPASRSALAAASPFTSKAPSAVADTASGSASGEAVFKPGIRILAVAVNPPQVARGGQVDLVVHYIVEGLPPSAAFEVTETRRLRRDQAALAETNEPVARTNGSYTSTQKAPVPAGAAAGVYRFDVTLRLAGAEATGSAVFEVQ